MGAIGGLLGLNGGINGTGFNTTQGVNGNQLNQAYNQVQGAMQGQQGLLDALQNQGGLKNQSNVYGQLQNVVSGQGPNPAQAMLNQATGQNVANQAALMAGQRGGSQNAGMIARQAGQQGAGIQQQAAGQGATMQANQALNALQQAGGMANTMAGQQIGQTNQNVASQQAEQAQLQQANQAQNQIQGQLAGQQMQNQKGVLGGLANAAGSMLGLFADGGAVSGPQSMFGQSLRSAPMANGGVVPAMVSPGEHRIPKEMVPKVAGGEVNPLKVGETFPGKPKVKGDNYKNDVIPKKLPVGDIIIPNSIMQSKDPVRGSAEFVRAIMAKKGKKA